MTAKMTAKELATYMARTAEVLEQLREFGETLTYKQLAENINLIPRNVPWTSHFRQTMPKLVLILNMIAAAENELGRDASDLVKWVVEGKTGEPGIGYHNRVDLVITRRPN